MRKFHLLILATLFWSGLTVALALSNAYPAQMSPAQNQVLLEPVDDIKQLPMLQNELRFTCTLGITTTDSVSGNYTYTTAYPMANYTGLALAPGNLGQQILSEVDYYKFGNVTPGWTYVINAIPDGLGNYNLGMSIYDGNFIHIQSDQNSINGNSADISFIPTTTGPYYVVIYQISGQCSGGTYRITGNYQTPTPTPTNTPTPTPTNTPFVPTATYMPGSDQYEPNFDFDHATTIAPGLTFNLNFIPWGGSTSSDNDYFKIWIKPGLTFSCETLELDPGVDTNIIYYNNDRQQIGGNDDRTLGDYSSKITYYSNYEGYLYMLVGQGDRMAYQDTARSNYKMRCTMIPPNATITPGGPTFTPVPDKNSYPTSQPTQPPGRATATPTLTPEPTVAGNVNLTYRLITTPAPSGATPTPGGFRTFKLRIYLDSNQDLQPGAGEGIPGFFVRVLNPESGSELARGYTDDQGQLSFTVPTIGSVQIQVPQLGMVRLIDPGTPDIQIRIAPPPLPGAIP